MMWYKTFLPSLHEEIRPLTYVEIGIRHGYSLSLSPAAIKVAIDPNYGAQEMQFEVPNTSFFKMASDDFFARYDLEEVVGGSFDLAYIDGLHKFEYALRDFINLEKYSSRRSVIIVDDVIPRNEDEASREPTGGSWTGDVWKIIDCFRVYRPDLAKGMILARSEPTGCLIITNPNASNKNLSLCYDEIMDRYLAQDFGNMPSKELLELAVSAERALELIHNRSRPSA